MSVCTMYTDHAPWSLSGVKQTRISAARTPMDPVLPGTPHESLDLKSRKSPDPLSSAEYNIKMYEWGK